MRRGKFIIIGFAGLLLLGISAVALFASTQTSKASELSQKEIELIAVTKAQGGLHYSRLTTKPGSVVSKRITLGEFHARLDRGSQDPTDPNTPVWIVVIKGNIAFAGPPNKDGTITRGVNDNLWVVLTTTGDPIAWGGLRPGQQLDLTSPPPTIGPHPTSVVVPAPPR